MKSSAVGAARLLRASPPPLPTWPRESQIYGTHRLPCTSHQHTRHSASSALHCATAHGLVPCYPVPHHACHAPPSRPDPAQGRRIQAGRGGIVGFAATYAGAPTYRLIASFSSFSLVPGSEFVFGVSPYRRPPNMSMQVGSIWVDGQRLLVCLVEAWRRKTVEPVTKHWDRHHHVVDGSGIAIS